MYEFDESVEANPDPAFFVYVYDELGDPQPGHGLRALRVGRDAGAVRVPSPSAISCNGIIAEGVVLAPVDNDVQPGAVRRRGRGHPRAQQPEAVILLEQWPHAVDAHGRSA